MSRKLTLAGRLTLGTVLVMVPVSLILLFLFFRVFNADMEAKLFDLVERGTIASGKVVAESVSFDVKIAAEEYAAAKSTSQKKDEANLALREMLEEKLAASSSSTTGYFIFTADLEELARAERVENAVPPEAFMPLLTEIREKVVAVTSPEEFETSKNEGAFDTSLIQADRVVAVILIAAETEADGYLVYVESIAEYRSSQDLMFALMTLSLMMGLLLIAFSVIVIGRRSARPIHRIAETAQRIAEGDLTYRADDETGVKETLRLNAAVREMADALALQVNSIKLLTGDAAAVSKDVTVAMETLSESASQQASAVAETAATVVQLEKTGKSAAANAKQIVEAAEKTTEASIRGQQAVDTTHNIIYQIKDDAQEISVRAKALLAAVQEIGDIINSVNAISEQSKILAVNASIEAAKAGEFGAGFAVVAQEVKSLAQQSKEATLEITGTLTGIRNAIEGMVDLANSGEARTETGVTTVGNTGAIVNDLSEAIRENSHVADKINASVAQQTIGLSQIATSIEQISGSAMANQEISKKTEKSTQKMEHALKELAETVAKWRTGDEETESDEPQDED